MSVEGFGIGPVVVVSRGRMLQAFDYALGCEKQYQRNPGWESYQVRDARQRGNFSQTRLINMFYAYSAEAAVHDYLDGSKWDTQVYAVALPDTPDIHYRGYEIDVRHVYSLAGTTGARSVAVRDKDRRSDRIVVWTIHPRIESHPQLVEILGWAFARDLPPGSSVLVSDLNTIRELEHIEPRIKELTHA